MTNVFKVGNGLHPAAAPCSKADSCYSFTVVKADEQPI